MKKRFSQLEDLDKVRVLLILLRLVNTRTYIFKDFASGVRGDIWTNLPGLVDKIMGEDTLIIDFVTTNNPWLRTENRKMVVFKEGKYEIK